MAEIFLQHSNQNHAGYGRIERVALKGYCLFSSGAGSYFAGTLPKNIQRPEYSRCSALDGREQNADDGKTFDNASYVNFNDGRVKFDTNRVDNANENYGSSSAFLPKYLFMLVQVRLGEFVVLIVSSNRQAFCRLLQGL